MKVTFKNVGQGDTVILEWLKDNQLTIGIIDCKKVDNINPAKSYLQNLEKQGKPFSIEFVALSHPHFDHYSGLYDLLAYSNKRGFLINYFFHSMQVDQRYLDWANLNDHHTSALVQLIEQVIAMNESQTIKKIAYFNFLINFPLYKGASLFCLGPSDTEIRFYTRSTDMFKQANNEYKASQAANLLSTFLLLKVNNKFLAFTSDSTADLIRRIFKDDMERVANEKLVLVQVPHHGSKENHVFKFWQNLNYDMDCPAVFSAGKNLKYAHPHEEVVKDFDENNFKIFSTNNVNGIQEYLSEQHKLLSKKLDLISKKINPTNFDGDQVFELEDEELIYIPTSA